MITEPIASAAAAPALTLTGKMSTFGGPADTGVGPSEGLALLSVHDLLDSGFAGLFLSKQPPGTSGLARRLNPAAYYLACRWDYQRTPPSMLRHARVRLTNLETGAQIHNVRPVDWGPNVRTGRIADLSPGAAKDLGLATNDMVRVELFPA